MRWKPVGLSLFLIWVVYWAFRYVTRPIPDEQMISVFAAIFAFIPALLLAFFFALRLVGWLVARIE